MKDDSRGSSHAGRLVASAFCLFVFMTGMLVVRVYRAGEAALVSSERAFDEGDLETATTSAREALTWYLPGAPHVELAIVRLRAIAVGAEATGDVTSALRAWEALRGGLFETAHPWSTTSSMFEEAGAGVARLLMHSSRGNTPPTTDKQADSDEKLRGVYRAPLWEAGRDWFALGSSLGMALILICGARVLSGRQLPSAAEVVFTRAGLLVGLSIWLLAAIGY
jgi:hypothetical protein